VFWIKANSEEKLMTEHFPNEYPSYKERTWRLIPYVL
jgi:protein-S-isoprenylcysteine O-methyltransferase Ste14